MKRIYVILFTAALSASIFSCGNKTNDPMGTGDSIKDSTTVSDEIQKESKKTTENGGDAH